MKFGEPRQLTCLQGNCSSAVFSPDGKWIAFGCVVEGRCSVYLMRCDGSDLTRMTDGGVGRGEKSYFDPHFSRDGAHLVCVRTDGLDEPDDGCSDICLLNIGAGTEQLLTDRRLEGSPSFSPDGHHILFTSARDTATKGAFVREIYQMRADGSKQTRLTYTEFDRSLGPAVPHNNTEPHYSPDGQYIAFGSSARGKHGEDQFEVYRMNTDGSQLVRLTYSTGSSPYALWHPDGTRLVFTCWSKHPQTNENKVDIYSINMDGSDQHLLMASNAVNWLGSICADGKYLAFDSSRDGLSTGTWDIFLWDMEKGDLLRITDNVVFDKKPTFSPDGTQLMFRSKRTGWVELYLADVVS
jgi:TolB protein